VGVEVVDGGVNKEDHREKDEGIKGKFRGFTKRL
jgi:hypothetical protein